MGATITAKGAKAPWNAKFLPVVASGLEAWFVMGGDRRTATLNRAVGKPDGILTGSPEVFENYIKFTGGVSFVDTFIADNPDFTHIIVARRGAAQAADGAADSCMILGNYTSPTDPATLPPGVTVNTTFGNNFYFGQNTNAFTVASAKTNAENGVASHAVVQAMNDPMKWQLAAGIGGNTDSVRMKNFTENTENTAGSGGAFARVVGTRNLRIGGGFVSGNFKGKTDIAFIASWRRKLTEAEFTAQVAQIRTLMLQRGFSGL